MRHTKTAKTMILLLCAALLTGCGTNGKERETTSQENAADTSPDGKEETTGSDSENAAPLADTSSTEQSVNLDDLLNTAVLRGSVSDFQDGSFQVVPDQDDGQLLMSAAPGMEDDMESTKVSYGEDCVFQTAHIESATGTVILEAASASDVKKSTNVYVYGTVQENGEIHATKVLILRFQY